MTEPEKKPDTLKPVLRLVFQGSIPFKSSEAAEEWYKLLKELVVHESLTSTLNGQIVKLLEPCCGDKRTIKLFPGVPSPVPPGFH